ncbi:uncharacterized protein SPAPADRAFT_61127 [Spathaspora passalidarum NRRL Y-27907]|uniref:Plasma membrane proteolipid 3 n=1 Tax=Spathaspora passalidarum (strain NRRL Y-27907 / 11-Y1) TaxID=619300 RepID=G3ANT9_SPAPN|nr:uncharacterized protein SPAPADRAFT_61127 [Spathaspora passalidarum NRRL Y-27907]EGW32024.1 hypothetical protein SPAPADRAFT_61127 [Spathaspora passalidarum NRRL Y-27907]
MDSNDWLLIILAFLIPPIPVIVKKGCSNSVFLNILLCLLGGVFGIIHAVYVVATNPYESPYYDFESYRSSSCSSKRSSSSSLPHPNV